MAKFMKHAEEKGGHCGCLRRSLNSMKWVPHIRNGTNASFLVMNKETLHSDPNKASGPVTGPRIGVNQIGYQPIPIAEAF